MIERMKAKIVNTAKAFWRAPHKFLWLLFWNLAFRCMGFILCVLLTVLPLPLSNFMQQVMNLQLSFDSVRKTLESVRIIAGRLGQLMPSINDMMRVFSPANVWGVLKNLSSAVSPDMIMQFLRNVPSGLRQFCVTLFDNIRQRWRDLKGLWKSLFPLKDSLKRFRSYVRSHVMAVRRLMQNAFQMAFSLLLVKMALMLIVPLVGAVYLLGVDVTLLAAAAISLISSQLGTWIGTFVSRMAIRAYSWCRRLPSLTGHRYILEGLRRICSGAARLIVRLRLFIIKRLEQLVRRLKLYIVIACIWTGCVGRDIRGRGDFGKMKFKQNLSEKSQRRDLKYE